MPVDVLARTIYGEARGESKKGKEAIACVILNRVRKKTWYGKTVDDVCLKPWQFSCWNKNDPNREKIKAVRVTNLVFFQCYEIARKAVCGGLEDVTNGATHYHTKSISPKWAKGKSPCAEIGHHLFYNNID
jgi:spore germination cell wall hydrolase CwlJ-like protein